MVFNIYDVLNVVALRKTEFFNKIWQLLQPKIKNLSDKEKNNIKDAFVKVISNMSNDLFISKDERTNKVLHKDWPIHKLKLNEKEILKEFNTQMKKQYPKLKY
jgi:hypothetical protein